MPALRGYQARVLAGLLRGIAREPGATFTVLCPRQSGKNEVAAELVACLLRTNAARGGSVIICAPTASPQAEISLRRVRNALARTDRLFPESGRHRADGNTLFVGAASATFLSASPEAHVAGHTASLALIADEAQEVEGAWFDRQFRPMAASTGAPTVLFGTPWDGRSLLDRAVVANRASAPHRHYQVGWREVAAAVPRYDAYVRQERERLGAGHPLFVTQYLLGTVEAAGRLFSAAQLARLAGMHPRLPAPLAGERYVGGLDFGGDTAGADATVLTLARSLPGRCEVVAHFAWQGAPFEAVQAEVEALARQWRLARLCIDATGLGQPLAASLEKAFPRVAEGVRFTAAVKSALGFALLAAAETGRLALYKDDGSAEARACAAELAACGRQPSPPGELRWGDARGHDDFVASLALCLRAHETLGPPRVAVGRRG